MMVVVVSRGWRYGDDLICVPLQDWAQNWYQSLTYAIVLTEKVVSTGGAANS